MAKITASVGIAKGKPCYNVIEDQLKIQALLSRISPALGGCEGRSSWSKPVWHQCAPDLHQAILNFQRINRFRLDYDPDGHVDPHDATMRLMNELAAPHELPPSPGPKLFAEEPIDPDVELAVEADGRRVDALRKAIQEVTRLKNTFEPNPPDLDDPVVLALKRQLFVPINSNFWTILNSFLAKMQHNLATKSFFTIDKGNPAFAHVDPSNSPMKGVTICASFFAPSTTDNCRHEVVTHEFFHFVVGLQHFYSTQVNDEAMKCPHHLARAVFDIALRQQLAPCSLNETSCR